jgi:hypothetical protein
MVKRCGEIGNQPCKANCHLANLQAPGCATCPWSLTLAVLDKGHCSASAKLLFRRYHSFVRI